MSQALPTHDFSGMNFMEMADDAEEGCILEVDLEYPRELHDDHSDYPLAPEQVVVTPDMWSPYTRDLATKFQIPPGSSTKLVPNLRPKNRYVMHYRNLKQCVSLGLHVTKIHRVLTFKQSPWLATYIEFNTRQRKLAKSSFGKDLFKLLNNSVFGKMMENLRKRTCIDLVHREKRAKKLVAAPTFHSFKIITDDLAAIERRKTSLVLNRPIYVGFSVLDLSKTLMYQFHYQYIKKTYASKARLLFTDTDSLCYEIETDAIFQDMGNNLNLFDTSDYPENHPLYSLTNKKTIGKMKDELSGQIAQEFVGLKPKMYSLLSNSTEKKTAKGVSKTILKRQIRHVDYVNCLLQQQRGLAHAQRIASHSHQIKTVAYTKATLCPFDTKRYLLDDGISSYAYGHYAI
ncbi:uncharacterized protein LOC118203166 isoform X1 [Stegodyphus dumicola]|uniref:uncharacterized protein LOC118203166 isoform X1 n=1 Tax=Stegodyphus dumicola TaxID=202533 RepID=UPI0015A7D195|nr:uncharacterized protein LOC118203166 isoform X1 [Stegodyphus dumicola]